MQAIPQPSGWPDFGFGWGHPKSLKFLPVSARARNAMSVSTGAGFWLTIASIRHMSAQLVSKLPERSEERRVGKSVDLGGRRIIKKKKKTNKRTVTCRYYK